MNSEQSSALAAALAPAFASDRHPAAGCEPLLARLFAHDGPWFATADEKNAVRALLDAARDEGVDLMPRVDRMLDAIDWSFPDARQEYPLLRAVLAEAFEYNDQPWAMYTPRGAWAPFNARTLIDVAAELSQDPAERRALGGLLVRAVGFGDAAALEACSARLAQARASGAAPRLSVRFVGPPDVNLRLFSVVTAGLSPADRALWTARAGHSFYQTMTAASAWLAGQHGVALPPIPPHQSDTHSLKAWYLAILLQFFGLLRAHLPGCHDEALQAALDNAGMLNGSLPDLQSSLCEALADEQHTTPTGSRLFRVGTVVAHFNRGRLFLKRHPSVKAADRDVKKKLAG